MLNRTTRDLDDPTVRVRMFAGRSASDVAGEMPMLPCDAPGMPPPGPSFFHTATLLGDPDPYEPTLTAAARRKKAAAPDGPWLHALVRSALYQCGTTVSAEFNGNRDNYQLQAGLLSGPSGDSYGPGPCRLFVVGKCLGRVEVNTGRPFAGPGSRPLWEAWAEAGLPLAVPGSPGAGLPTFFNNLVRFDPPAPATPKLPRDWVRDGMHLLYQELALCRPEYVLLLGADALKAFFGNAAKVDDYRGRTARLTVDCRPSADTPEDRHCPTVLVADHPAKVSRAPDEYPNFLASMRYAARQLGFGRATVRTALDHQAVLTLDELKRAAAESERASAAGGYVAFDCEWDGPHPSHPDSYLYTVQWSHGPGHARVAFLRRCGGAPNPALPADKAAPVIRRLLADAPGRGARLVGHFAKADLPWLESIGVDAYDAYVGPADDPDPDGEARLWGWQKTYFEGAFDTYVAAHCVEENATKKLEVLAASWLGVDRYDTPIMEWKDQYARDNDISKGKITGYGNVPEHVIMAYAAMDADVAGRLYLHLNGNPLAGTSGALDKDHFGNSCRQVFGLRMRAWAAWAEMERHGLLVDRYEHARLRNLLARRRDELLEDLREQVGWYERTFTSPDGQEVRYPAFDPARRLHRLDLLFGEKYLDGADSPRPPGACSLNLVPFKATQTRGGGRLWAEALARQGPDDPPPMPAADKESLCALARSDPLAAVLRDVDYLTTAAKIMFRAPDDVTVDEGDEGDLEAVARPEGEIHGTGLLSHVQYDGRIRSTFGFVETGRMSSSRPNLQNVGASADEQYDRILKWGEKHAPEGTPEHDLHFTSRSIFVAQAGWYFVSADLKGAEIAAAAWSSGDPVLIEDAARASLDPGDPNFLDLHADLANVAFNLNLPLKEVKKKFPHLRTAAKRARFGHYYGASPETILRKIWEEDPSVTLEQVREIVAGHDRKYPALAGYFAACRARVSDPWWMCNGFGGYRRCRASRDRDLRAAQEREFQNNSCQGLVADAITTMLGNIWGELRRRKMRTRVVLSVHDSVMLESPADEVAAVVDEVLPLCMIDRCPVVPTDLSGNPVARGPYFFDIDVSVYRRWGVEVPEAQWRGSENCLPAPCPA